MSAALWGQLCKTESMFRLACVHVAVGLSTSNHMMGTALTFSVPSVDKLFIQYAYVYTNMSSLAHKVQLCSKESQ